ncbi:hypothetical protein ACS0TY_002429 [Phlomoides rotata]
MALLVPSPEIFSLAVRETPATAIPRTGSRNVRLISVCSGVKDLKKADLKLRDEDGVRWLYGQVKESATAPFPSNKGKEEKLDYYVNTGYAIRTLRKEFPELFYRELNFDIYRALWVDITSMWQPMENTIRVRWTVHGIPRIPWERRSRFDGTSEYKLDKDGKIYEHKVHNIALNGSQTFPGFAVDSINPKANLLIYFSPTQPHPWPFHRSTQPQQEFGARGLAALPPFHAATIDPGPVPAATLPVPAGRSIDPVVSRSRSNNTRIPQP